VNRQLLFTTLVLAGCAAAPSLEERVHGESQGLSLPGISFQTLLGGKYLSAQNDGGGAVTAAASTVQAWERFSLIDVNGGSLQSGDSVFIQAGSGQYFQALNGGGSTLNAASSNQLGWETFKVVKPSGGSIANGDTVGLQASSGSWVSAQNGGGGPVFAYGGALGSWEQLKITGLSASSPQPQPQPPGTTPTTIANVSLKTTLRGNFVGAQNGGGGAVTATATVAQGWETFAMIDVNGGALQSGDSVFIQASNGQYFQALNGGGSSLNAASSSRLGWETFKVVKAGGGAVNSGDVIGLQASSGAWVSAENGGGGRVFAL